MRKYRSTKRIHARNARYTTQQPSASAQSNNRINAAPNFRHVPLQCFVLFSGIQTSLLAFPPITLLLEAQIINTTPPQPRATNNATTSFFILLFFANSIAYCVTQFCACIILLYIFLNMCHSC
jgi:hypothetical protein